MTDASFASLSSTLLARKGGAKPAMRPQSTIAGPVNGAAAAANLEDLGWNDMGEEMGLARLQVERPTNPANDYQFADVITIGPQSEINLEARNDVRESIDRIARTLDTRRGGEDEPAAEADAFFEPEPEPEPEPTVSYEPEFEAEPLVAEKRAPRPKPVMRTMRRAAFTLRLDQQRHLMLKLACTVRGCSAQQLVSDALDEVLAEMPEIASLAAQVKREPN